MSFEQTVAPLPIELPPQRQPLHRALDQCTQIASALRAMADLLSVTDEVGSVARDDLAMLLALLDASGHELDKDASEIAQARTAVVDLIGSRQELDGVNRTDLRCLLSVVAARQEAAVAALSAGVER